MTVASLLLAAVAAVCNAFSSVMQRKANRDEPAGQPFGPGLILHLIRQRSWLLGFLAMLASFLLQATALGLGTLSAVEPVLVIELPLTMIIGAYLLHHPLHVQDWVSAAAMAFGLGLFISVLSPSGGDAASMSEVLAVTATAGTAVGIAALAAAGQLGPRRSRAALFGAAAGSGFGLTAALIKVAVSRLSSAGAVGLFTAWETYAVAVAGVASVLLVQAALHAGTLVAAQPGITLLDPLVSLLWGVIVLDETVRVGPILVLAGVGAVIIAAAVIYLAHRSGRADRVGATDEAGMSSSPAGRRDAAS